MRMRHEKWIALFVILAFIGLTQAAVVPLRATPAPARAETATAGPGSAPGVIEEAGSPPAPAGRKSILPIVAGVVALGAIAAVLALVVFKTRYDIVGRWDFSFTSSSPAHTWIWTLLFSGDRKSGKFADGVDTGTYSVEGKKVVILYDYDAATKEGWDIQLTGQFEGKDRMTGSATFAGLTIGDLPITSATWTAARLAAGNALRPGAAAPSGRKTKKGGI